jgi:hypothetical protein
MTFSDARFKGANQIRVQGRMHFQKGINEGYGQWNEHRTFSLHVRLLCVLLPGRWGFCAA